MLNCKLRDSGNAVVLEKKVCMESNIVMLRFENIFDAISEEPVIIAIKTEEDAEERQYENIFRIRIWNDAGKCCSWSIYSGEREELKDFVIRRVIWNREEDVAFAKRNIRKNREMVLKSDPSIVIYNKYVPVCTKQSETVACLMDELDSEIKDGFVLNRNHNPTWEWRDLEVLRLYDWGQIHLTWNMEKKNDVVEKKVKEVISGLSSIVETYSKEIYSMTLYYAKNSGV